MEGSDEDEDLEGRRGSSEACQFVILNEQYVEFFG
jgi:hypothetical protein